MKIAIIDDQQEIRYSVSKILQKHEHNTIQFNGLESDIIESLQEHAVKLIIVDVMLSESFTGIDLVKQIKKSGFDIPIILMTAYTTPENMIEASKIGIKDILQKPFDENQLMQLVNKFISVNKKEPLAKIPNVLMNLISPSTVHLSQRNSLNHSSLGMKKALLQVLISSI
jgi:DNA-binding NtrC family response regulator